MGFWLAIFAGGGLGACLRVALMIAIDARSGSAFPWGLLAVNTLGCFSIGLVASFADEAGWLAPIPRAFAVAGRPRDGRRPEDATRRSEGVDGARVAMSSVARRSVTGCFPSPRIAVTLTPV